MNTNTPSVDENLTALASTVSDATVKSINDFLDVTGYVYGIVNLITPAVTLDAAHKTDQTNYDEFRTNLSVYKGKAELWIQPTKVQPNDVVTQITAMPAVITGISSLVVSDISTLITLGPTNAADPSFSGPVKTLIKAGKTQVDSLIAQIKKFKADVIAGNAKMDAAYKGILANVDADLAAEISGLQTTINSLQADVKAAQKKVTKEEIGEGFAIGAIVVGALTAWTGVGALILGAGIAGVVLTKAEIAALNAEIAADKLSINTDFTAMADDKQAKVLVVLFQASVKASLEAHDAAIAELTEFSTLLGTLDTNVENAYNHVVSAVATTDPAKWKKDLNSALTEWKATNALATVLATIVVKVTPPTT